MLFSVTYYLELHIPISFYYWVKMVLYQVKMLMSYNVQTTNIAFVGENK